MRCFDEIGTDMPPFAALGRQYRVDKLPLRTPLVARILDQLAVIGLAEVLVQPHLLGQQIDRAGRVRAEQDDLRSLIAHSEPRMVLRSMSSVFQTTDNRNDLRNLDLNPLALCVTLFRDHDTTRRGQRRIFAAPAIQSLCENADLQNVESTQLDAL